MRIYYYPRCKRLASIETNFVRAAAFGRLLPDITRSVVAFGLA
ncbi:hypothetical protein ACW73L_15165 [Methylolobus aquaticus]